MTIFLSFIAAFINALRGANAKKIFVDEAQKRGAVDNILLTAAGWLFYKWIVIFYFGALVFLIHNSLYLSALYMIPIAVWWCIGTDICMLPFTGQVWPIDKLKWLARLMKAEETVANQRRFGMVCCFLISIICYVKFLFVGKYLLGAPILFMCVLVGGLRYLPSKWQQWRIIEFTWIFIDMILWGLV